MMKHYRIGIDSGGTHVVAVAYQKDGKILKTSQSGPGNILLDCQQTLVNLKQAIAPLAESFKTAQCDAILIGIAGMESASQSQKALNAFKAVLQQQFSCSNIQIVSDAQLGLINGLEGRDGFLVIAGTGSICYGTQKEIEMRVGGWGGYLSDEGSGYRISQSAIKTVLSAFDHQQESDLQAASLAFFEAKDISELVTKFYQLSRPQIADFARVIGELALHGNSEARRILSKQGQLLGHNLCTLIQNFEKQSIPCAYQVAFSGSVLIHNSIVRNALLALVQKEYPAVKANVVTRNNSAGVLFI